MQRIIPHPWFDGVAEDAAALCAGRIDDGAHVARYAAAMTVEFDPGGAGTVGVNAGPVFEPTPAVSCFVMLETATAVDRFRNGLAPEGSVLTPLDASPWGERHGWLNDRYGGSWQVALGKRADTGRTVTPRLLLAGARCGRANEAVNFSASVFPDARSDSPPIIPPAGRPIRNMDLRKTQPIATPRTCGHEARPPAGLGPVAFPMDGGFRAAFDLHP